MINLERVKNIWNVGAESRRLDFFRIFFSMACLLTISKFAAFSAADLPDCMWAPPGIAAWLLPNPLSLAALKALKVCFAISLVLLALGIFSRLAALASGFFVVALLGTYHAALFYDPSGNITVIIFFILAAAPTLGSSLSVDSLWRKKQDFIDSDYIWPQRLIQFLFFFIYFAAGLSKVLAFNNWPAAENIIAILKWTRQNFGAGGDGGFRDILHHYIISSPAMAHAIGIVTILFEIMVGIFFFFPKRAYIGALFVAIFHLGIVTTMYFTFALFLPVHLIFIPWEKFFDLYISKLRRRAYR